MGWCGINATRCSSGYQWVYKVNAMKTGLLFHLLDLFKEDAIYSVSSTLFEIAFVSFQEPFLHQVQIVIEKVGFVGRFGCTLLY